MAILKGTRNAALRSWRTTALGLVLGLMMMAHQVAAYLDDDPRTVVDWNVVATALGAMGLGIAARDNGVRSEEATR